MWKMSFCDSDQKSMPIVGFLTCNGSVILCGQKLVHIGRWDTELISRLQHIEKYRTKQRPKIRNCIDVQCHLLESGNNQPIDSARCLSYLLSSSFELIVKCVKMVLRDLVRDYMLFKKSSILISFLENVAQFDLGIFPFSQLNVKLNTLFRIINMSPAPILECFLRKCNGSFKLRNT